MEEKTIYYISEAAKKVQVENHVLRYWEEELQLPIKRNEMGHRYYTEQDVQQLQEIKLLKEQGLQLKAIRTVLFKMPKLNTDETPIQSTPVPKSGEAPIQSTPTPKSDEAPIQSTPASKSGEALNQSILELKSDRTLEQPMPALRIEEMLNQSISKLEPEETPNQPMSDTGIDEKKTPDGTGLNNQTEIRRDKLMDMVKERVEAKTEELGINQDHRYVMTLSGDADGTVQSKQEGINADKNQKAARLQYLLQHMITEAVKSANRELCAEVKDSILKELDYQFRMQEERDEEHWKREEEHYRKIDEMIRERHKPREKLGRGRKKG